MRDIRDSQKAKDLKTKLFRIEGFLKKALKKKKSHCQTSACNVLSLLRNIGRSPAVAPNESVKHHNSSFSIAH